MTAIHALTEPNKLLLDSTIARARTFWEGEERFQNGGHFDHLAIVIRETGACLLKVPQSFDERYRIGLTLRHRSGEHASMRVFREAAQGRQV